MLGRDLSIDFFPIFMFYILRKFCLLFFLSNWFILKQLFIISTLYCYFQRHSIYSFKSHPSFLCYHVIMPSTRSWFCAWWRHQMETFPSLLALCAGNSSVPGKFPAQRPVTWSFDVFFYLRLNKRLSKQSWGWWFAHYDVTVMILGWAKGTGMIQIQSTSFSLQWRRKKQGVWNHWQVNCLSAVCSGYYQRKNQS